MVKKILIILNILLFCQMLNAMDCTDDSVLALDINQSIEMALNNNLLLQNNNIDLKNIKYDLISSYNQFISASTDLTLSDQLLVNNQSFNISVNVGASVSAKSIMTVLQNVTDYQKGKLTYEQARQYLQIEIKKYYYNIIRLEKEIELVKYDLDRSKSLFDMALLNYKNGMISEIEKLQTEYSYKSIIPQLDELQKDHQNLLLTFAYLLGIDPNQNIRLISDFPDFTSCNIDTVTVELINDSLELQLLSKDLQSAVNDRNSAIAGFIPDFKLQYSVSSKNNFISPESWGFTQKLELSLGLALDSILPFSSGQTSVIQNQNLIQKTKNIIKDTKNTNTVKFKGILSTLDYLKKKFENHNLNIEIARKKYNMTEKLYNKSSTSYLELQEAKKDLNDAELALLNIQYEFLLEVYELESLINREIIK